MSKPKLQTAFGELEVEAVYANSLGYFAVTGKGFNRRTFMLTHKQYEELKKQLEAETNC